jgi:glycosyltransferase involved in cell wall biosynthesis
MPLINEQLPETKLYLAGRNMPEYYIKHRWKNVEVLGEVPDAATFERDKSILVVPLLSGGGVRIKIFQAMAMGKTVITTSIGVEGIAAENSKEVFIADTPEDFARKIIEVVQQPELIQQTGSAARKLIQEKYNRPFLIKNLLERYQRILNESRN